MRIALCNEVLAPMPFAAQCDYAAMLGYDGLEVAPFTLSDTPDRLTATEVTAARRAASDAGVLITGLHWLLVKPAGLSITSPDAAVRDRTIDVMKRLIELCAALGGSVLVHGSPRQRAIASGETHATAVGRVQDALAAIADTARDAGVVYCIEPLSRNETDVINTIAAAATIVDAIGSAHVRTMIDCSAAGLAEHESPSVLMDRWLPSGHIAHVQVNDPNRRGPGQGAMDFAPIMATLRRLRYSGVIAVEPFDYVPDGCASAARAIGYLRGVAAGLGT